jgi:hypothetical protein
MMEELLAVGLIAFVLVFIPLMVECRINKHEREMFVLRDEVRILSNNVHLLLQEKARASWICDVPGTYTVVGSLQPCVPVSSGSPWWTVAS